MQEGDWDFEIRRRLNFLPFRYLTHRDSHHLLAHMSALFCDQNFGLVTLERCRVGA